MAFHVGKKVVCVDFEGEAEYRAWYPDVVLPERKVVYTVRKVFERDGCEALLLNEIRNRDTPEAGFRSFRFRPVVERKTDISIFQKMLTPSTNKVDA